MLIFVVEYVDLACDNGDHAKTSEWWQTMRDLFAQSTNVGSSLLGALIGRSVASDVAKLAMVNKTFATLKKVTKSERLLPFGFA